MKRYKFQPGDLVEFIAREEDSVLHGCTSEMEESLNGKIFRITNVEQVDDYDADDLQNVEIEMCELTDGVSTDDLDWTFSNEMFAPYQGHCEPAMSFDEFLSQISYYNN